MTIKDEVAQLLDEVLAGRESQGDHAPRSRDARRFRTGVGFIALSTPCLAIGLIAFYAGRDFTNAAMWLGQSILMMYAGAWMIDRSSRGTTQPNPIFDPVSSTASTDLTDTPATIRRLK